MPASFPLNEVLTAIQNAVSEAERVGDEQHLRQLQRYYDEDGTPLSRKLKVPDTRPEAADGEWQEIEVPLISLVPSSAIRIKELAVEFPATVIGPVEGLDLSETPGSARDMEVAFGEVESGAGTKVNIRAVFNGRPNEHASPDITVTPVGVGAEEQDVEKKDVKKIIAAADQLLRECRDYFEAERLVDQVLERNPAHERAGEMKQQIESLREDHDRRVDKADQLVNQGNVEQAIATYQQVRVDYPWDEQLGAKIAEVQKQSKSRTAKYTDSRKAPSQVLGEESESPAPAREMLAKAQQQLAQLQYRAAIETAKGGLRTGYLPEQFTAVLDQARGRLDQFESLMETLNRQITNSQLDEARWTISEARGLKPDDAVLHLAEQKLNEEAAERDRHLYAASAGAETAKQAPQRTEPAAKRHSPPSPTAEEAKSKGEAPLTHEPPQEKPMPAAPRQLAVSDAQECPRQQETEAKPLANAEAETGDEQGGQVRVDASQVGVNYQLTVAGDPVGQIVPGNGATIYLPTGPLSEDTTFVIRATRANHPEIQVDLQETVTVTVRPESTMDTELGVSVAQPVVDHYGQTYVQLAGSELGVRYQLMVDGSPVGRAIEGQGSTIDLPTGPLVMDTNFTVVATRGTSICGELRQRASVAVRPNTQLAVGVAEMIVDYNAELEVVVAASQAGVSYQLTDGGHSVGQPVDGNENTISMPTGPLTSDTIFIVRATKINNPDISVDLHTYVRVTVRPNSALVVRAAESIVDGNAGTAVYVDNSQVGVSYQLTVGGNPLGEAVLGTGAEISLPSGPLAGETTFRVRATKATNRGVSVELQPSVTVTVEDIKQVAVRVADAVIDYDAATQVLVEYGESGVSYQLTARGYALGQAVDGNGAAISLPTGPLQEDTTFVVRATRTANPKVSTDLNEQPSVIVRPDTGRNVRVGR